MDLAISPPPAAVSAPALPGGAPGPGRELSVLTFNVKGLPWPIARGRRAAMRAIGERLAALSLEGRRPDIVLIQEGFRDDVDQLLRASGYRHRVEGPSARWGKPLNSGLHVLTDLPVESEARRTFQSCAGYDCLAAKGVLAVRLALPDGGRLTVLNTHLNSRRASGRPAAARLAHRRQQDELRAFLAARVEPGEAVIVGGDFNVRNAPDLYGYRAGTRPYRVVSEVCRPHTGCHPVETGPAPWLGSQDLQAFTPGQALDVRPIATAWTFDGVDGPRLSDHRGYIVRYRLAPASSVQTASLSASAGAGSGGSP